jgi:hypothetical protein
VITTRLVVTDLAQYEGSSALRRDLEHLSSEAGEKLLLALEVNGPESELRVASEESKDLKSAGGLRNFTGSSVCFSRPWVRTRPKLRLHSAQLSELQMSKRRAH